MSRAQWIFACLVASASLTCAQTRLPLEPQHNSGQGIYPAFEGWYENKDGTKTILIGYYNRNLKETMDIPIGPNNHIDPGGPDRGQPTHFLAGRNWGVFTITVPKDFDPSAKITWTITANGKTHSGPFDLNPLYVVAPFLDATGNIPPFIEFEPGGKAVQGPPREIAKTFTATVGTPLALPVWVADDAKVPVEMQAAPARLANRPPVSLLWSKFRGPGDVTFDKDRPTVQKTDFPPPSSDAKYTGTATTNATFSAPGDYILEVVANDYSGFGGGGFQCCWTTAQVQVSVK